jgi:hypothetical protein
MESAPLYAGSRYSATPVLLIWSAVLAEAVCVITTSQRRATQYAPALACLLLLVPVWVLDLRPANLRSSGPRWDAQVAAATRRCESHLIGQATLQISPPGWKIVLPCRDLT